MSGGGTKSKSYSTSSSASGSAQKWATPYAKEAIGSIQDVYNANQGNLAGIGNNLSGFSDILAQRFNANNDFADQGRGYQSDVIGGKYLQGNPYLEQIISRMRDGVSDEVNSQFSLSGRYGSGAHTGVLTDKLAGAELGARYTDYANERARQDAAAQYAAAVAGQGSGDYLQAQALGAEIPYIGANMYANNLASLFNGGTSTATQRSSSKTGGGLFNSLIGAGAQIGAAAISQRDQKKNIEKVGSFKDGLGIYEFEYKDEQHGKGRFRGVMADEVEKLRPWALGPKQNGIQTVDYSKLGAA